MAFLTSEYCIEDETLLVTLISVTDFLEMFVRLEGKDIDFKMIEIKINISPRKNALFELVISDELLSRWQLRN